MACSTGDCNQARDGDEARDWGEESCGGGGKHDWANSTASNSYKHKSDLVSFSCYT